MRASSQPSFNIRIADEHIETEFTNLQMHCTEQNSKTNSNSQQTNTLMQIVTETSQKRELRIEVHRRIREIILKTEAQIEIEKYT